MHRASASAPYSLSKAVCACHVRSAGSAPPQSASCFLVELHEEEQKRANKKVEKFELRLADLTTIVAAEKEEREKLSKRVDKEVEEREAADAKEKAEREAAIEKLGNTLRKEFRKSIERRRKSAERELKEELKAEREEREAADQSIRDEQAAQKEVLKELEDVDKRVQVVRGTLPRFFFRRHLQCSPCPAKLGAKTSRLDS